METHRTFCRFCHAIGGIEVDAIPVTIRPLTPAERAAIAAPS